MKKDDISKLLQHYLAAREAGTEPYFDADEIDSLLSNFEEEENFAHYEDILALGFKLHPTSNELKIRKCRQLLYNGECTEALKLVESIAQTNNQDLDMVRLECYCTLEKYSQALEYIEDLMKNGCDYLKDIFEFLAPVLCDLDMTNEARDFVDRGLLLYPKSLILRDELCYLYEENGQYQEAIDVCNNMIDDDPYSYDLWFTLGRLYSLIPDYDKAIDAFDFALTCNESDIELKILKAYCLFMNENYRKAIEVYTEIATDNDSKYRIKPLMAECYIKLNEYEEAYGLLKDIIHCEDEIPDATIFINFIRCCVETERKREASQMLKSAVRFFPENIRILSLLALSYLEAGNEKLALSITNKIFEQLDQIDSEDIDLIDMKLLSKPEKYIPIKDLAKEYINNKDNSN